MNNTKLYRSETNKMIAGVCGGLADYLQIDTTLLRLVWVLIVVFSGFFPGVLVYIIAALIMPAEPKAIVTPPPTSNPTA
jgi:phage shock protein C